MLKLTFALTAVTAALLLARFAMTAQRARRADRDNMKGDVHRWEEEGGTIVPPQPYTPPEPASP